MNTELRFSGDIPRNYDTGMGPILFQFMGEELAKRIAGLHPHDVLTVSCGTGIDTRATKDLLPNARVTATDVNPDMMAIAQEKFAPGEVNFKIADFQELPFPDGSFDAVVCQFGIMFVPDKDKAVQEARRVLRPGGTLIFTVWDTMDKNSYAMVVQRLIEDTCKTDPPMFLHTPFGFTDRSELRALLERNGFNDVRIEDVVGEKPFEGHQLAKGMLYGSPAHVQLQERPEVNMERFESELRSRMETYAKEHGGKLPLHAVFISGKKD